MPENRFEFFELYGCQVRHIPSYQLILQKRQFLGNGALDETELVGEFVIGVSGEVVFFNICLRTLLVEEGESGEKGVQGGEVLV